MSRIRVAVAALSRSGLLNANETAVFDTPARSATLAIVTRRATCSKPLLLGVGPRRPGPCRRTTARRGDRWSRVAGCVSLGDKTGLANRFTDRNRDGRATSMVHRHN